MVFCLSIVDAISNFDVFSIFVRKNTKPVLVFVYDIAIFSNSFVVGFSFVWGDRQSKVLQHDIISIVHRNRY